MPDPSPDPNALYAATVDRLHAVCYRLLTLGAQQDAGTLALQGQLAELDALKAEVAAILAALETYAGALPHAKEPPDA